jgi:hypothetical protein
MLDLRAVDLGMVAYALDARSFACERLDRRRLGRGRYWRAKTKTTIRSSTQRLAVTRD